MIAMGQGRVQHWSDDAVQEDWCSYCCCHERLGPCAQLACAKDHCVIIVVIDIIITNSTDTCPFIALRLHQQLLHHTPCTHNESAR